ncbi:hypothetical protein NYF20_06740 [Lactobacillus delbrueckii]
MPTVTANLVDKGIIGKNLPYYLANRGQDAFGFCLGPAGGFW